MRATAFILGIVVIAGGCDKADQTPAAVAIPSLNLDSNPDFLFHIFGERDQAKMMPLAAIQGNQIVDINLAEAGWKQLDAKYLQPGTSYPTFLDGRPSGTITIDRGMWTGDPLYALPGCTNLIPMANVTLSDTTRLGHTVEQFATTRAAVERPRGKLMPADSVRAIAKQIGYEIGKGVKLEPAFLDSLDFRAAAIETGARERPTIIVWFMEHSTASGGGGNAAHVFVIADDDGTGYKSSFAHAVNGPAARAEFRSYLDHLDLTGDGIDELLIDGWHVGGETATRVFAWRNGTWREVFVGRSAWCVDPPKK